MKIIMLAALLWLPLFTFAQRGEHADAIEALTGFTRFGVNKIGSKYGNIGHGSVQAGYIKYFAPKWYYKAAGWYSSEVYDGGASAANNVSPNLLRHYVYGGDFYAGYAVWGGAESKLNIRLIAGITMSREYGKWQQTFSEEAEDYSQDKAGGVAGVELEYYFNRRWSVIANVNEHIVGTDANAVWGYKRWYISGGLRYHFHWNWPAKKAPCDIIYGQNQLPTQPSAKSSAKPSTKSSAKPSTKPSTKSSAKSSTKSSPESPTKPSSESPTKPSTESPTKPSSESPTKPSSESPTKPSSESPTKPSTESPTKSPTKPSTESPTKPSSESPTKPSSESPTKPSPESPTKSSPESPTKSSTESPTKR